MVLKRLVERRLEIVKRCGEARSRPRRSPSPLKGVSEAIRSVSGEQGSWPRIAHSDDSESSAGAQAGRSSGIGTARKRGRNIRRSSAASRAAKKAQGRRSKHATRHGNGEMSVVSDSSRSRLCEGRDRPNDHG
jgi:hypothetical protein